MIFLNLSPVQTIAQQGQNTVLPFLVVAAFICITFLVIFLDSFGGPILNTLVSAWEDLYFFLTKRSFSFYPVLNKKQLPHHQRIVLFEKVHYYKFLSSAQRKAFDHRIVRFLNTREFVAKQGVQLSGEMKLLIAASAIQISFGLRSYMINEFSKIYVYPKAFYNKITQRYHKGEVNPNGLVLLSWEDFVFGNDVPDDSLNLGIHEFAHTLALQRLNNRAYRDRIFVSSFDKLMANISNPVFRKKIQERAGLRAYAITNPMEFFAVATEAFFENPEQLYRNHKTIYELFVSMYNQELISLYNRPINPLTKSPSKTN